MIKLQTRTNEIIKITLVFLYRANNTTASISVEDLPPESYYEEAPNK